MKLTPEEKRSIYVKMIVIVLSIAVYFLFLRIDRIWRILSYMLEISKPILLGLSLAFVLNMVLAEIEKVFIKHLKCKNLILVRGISIVLTFLLFLILVSFMIASVVPKFIESIIKLFQQLPDLIDTSLDWLSRVELVADKLPQVRDFIEGINIVKLRDMAIDFLFGNMADTVTGTLSVVTVILQSSLNTSMTIIFSIYALAGKENLQSNSRKLLYAVFPEKFADSVNKAGKLLYANFYNFFTGQFLEALLLGAMCFVGMAILQMPYALMISVFVGFTNLIPYFGAFMGAVVSAVLIIITDPVKGLVFLVFIIIIQQIDNNYLYPKLVGNKMGIPSIWILISITLGGAIMGVAGMIIFVPLMATFYLMLKDYANNKLKEKNIDIDQKQDYELVIDDHVINVNESREELNKKVNGDTEK